MAVFIQDRRKKQGILNTSRKCFIILLSRYNIPVTSGIGEFSHGKKKYYPYFSGPDHGERTVCGMHYPEPCPGNANPGSNGDNRSNNRTSYNSNDNCTSYNSKNNRTDDNRTNCRTHDTGWYEEYR